MIYRFGTYSVDTDRLELSASGQAIKVQPQAFALLLFLVENHQRVVSKDEIIDSVWEGRIVSDATLNTRINALRRALGDSGESQSVIKTFPRRGFRFVADLDGKKEPFRPQSSGVSQDTPSIAVLPFVNISADREQVYFADGLTEDLITDLSKIRELFVIARNSSFSFRNSPKNVTEIGQELGVNHVLEGSVRKAGNRIRINAQLIDTNTGGHVWADRYDGDVQDIFEVQDEITRKIVTALQVNLTGAIGGSRSTHSVEAYELSLKGRAKFFMFSPETNAECIQLLDQAIAIDPEFSNAWAEQVFPYQSGWSFAWAGYDDGLSIAEDKARRAVELGLDSSLAHARLGWVQTFLKKPELSIASFERAVELDPNNADTYIWFSESLNYAGQPERALEVAEKSLLFEPVAPPNILHHIGHAYFLMGALEKAVDFDQRAIRMAPSFPPARIILCASLVECGKIEQAKQQIADLIAIDAGYTLARFMERYPYYGKRHLDRITTALKAAGLK